MNNMTKTTEYKTLFEKVSCLLEEAREKAVKQVNTVIVNTYWEVGRLIVEEEQKGKERAGYGEELIKRLAKDLKKRLGKGFTTANLWNMRQFYSTYSKLYALRRESKEDEKSCILRDQLTWTHFRILMRVEDNLAREFYEIEAIKNNWATRELERQINSLLYERLSLSKNKDKVMQLAKQGQIIKAPEDAIKNPFVLEFLGIPERHYYSESQLEQALIDHLQEFMLELGKGFTFVARQKRITIDNAHYYIDLIFYHRILRCLVLIDLKVGKLNHADVGQMNFYLNYIKANEIFEDENPPIGIILCTEANQSKVFVEYALGGLSNKLFVSKYKLYLPTKKELELEIKREAELLRLTNMPDTKSSP